MHNENDSLSPVVIHLLRGILYKEEKPQLWESMERLEGPVRDYLRILDLDVEIHNADGFAFIKSKEREEGDEMTPRLIARRPLSYPVSLILVLLRRKMTEHEAFSSEARMIMDKDEVAEMVSAFFPVASNEVKTLKKLDAHLQKIQELGFIRFLDRERKKLEVKRILKVFIDAQWLRDFDSRLEDYLGYGSRIGGDDSDE